MCHPTPQLGSRHRCELLCLMRARIYLVQPQTMQVAIGIDGCGLVFDMERGRSLSARVEVLDLASVLGLKVEELDVMLIGHRMRRLAYADGDGAVLTASDHWDMILGLAIGGVGFEPLHLLSAAMWHYLGSAHLEHDVATDWATVEDCLHNGLRF